MVVCKFAGCNQIYNDARILPCGKRTCAAHIDDMMVKFNCTGASNDDRKMLKCHFCEEIHSFPENGKEFPVDEYVPLLLNFKFNYEHDGAKTSFNEVTKSLDKLINFDKEAYVIDYFERVETDILIEKEANLQKLVAHYQKLVDEVHEHKIKCLHNLKTNKQLENELDAIKQTLIDHDNKLKTDNIDFMIKTVDGDQDKWEDIESECDMLFLKIQSSGEEVIERIVGDHLVRFWSNTESFQIDNMCGHLFLGPPDSMIINTDKFKIDLVDLCKLGVKQFKLLYRASRDGFKESVFYDKCDDHPDTLTIIKTSKGYIFGVYTSVALNGSNKFKIDASTFIFSLINASNQPQLIPAKERTVLELKNLKRRFYSRKRIFGFKDISIFDNSNSSDESFSDLGDCFDFELFSRGTIEAKSFLADSPTFQTTEIEVFQLLI